MPWTGAVPVLLDIGMAGAAGSSAQRSAAKAKLTVTAVTRAAASDIDTMRMVISPRPPGSGASIAPIPPRATKAALPMIPSTAKSKSFVTLSPGDPAPWFHQRSGSNPRYAFDTVAGRWVVMCFFGTAGDEDGKRALAAIATNRVLFDDEHASFFGVSLDPNDE